MDSSKLMGEVLVMISTIFIRISTKCLPQPYYKDFRQTVDSLTLLSFLTVDSFWWLRRFFKSYVVDICSCQQLFAPVTCGSSNRH